MAKRFSVYLSDEDIAILGDVSGKEIVDMAREYRIERGAGWASKRYIDIMNSNIDYILERDVAVGVEKESMVDRSATCVDVLHTKTMELLGMVHNDTQYIVESIKSRKVEKASMSDVKLDISPLQMERLNDAYEKYVQRFKEDKSWGTGDKDYKSTRVFKDPSPIFDELLHRLLKEYLLSLDIDYTIYGVEE
jgi:hypothetical protein